MKISISHFRKACMPTCMIRVYLVDATTKQTHVAFINLNVRINLDERIRLACLLAFANSATRGRRRLPLKSAATGPFFFSSQVACAIRLSANQKPVFATALSSFQFAVDGSTEQHSTSK